MKLIRLYAYLQDNLGDDLMVDILLKRYPNYKFIFGDYNFGISNEASLKYLSYKNYNCIRNIIVKFGKLNHFVNIITHNKKTDWLLKLIDRIIDKLSICSVYIGGSIFIQPQEVSVDSIISNEQNKMRGNPHFIIGSNFGPYYDQSFPDAFHTFFEQCAGVCFRDKKSYELFRDIPVVNYAPDVVFNYSECPVVQICNNIIISVIDFSKRQELIDYKDTYEHLIINICEHSIDSGLSPVLVSFCDAEGDMNAIQRVLDSLDDYYKPKAKAYSYDNVESMIRLFASAKGIICTRFHSMILALKLNKPFWCFSYNEKIINVLNDINCHSYCVPQEFDKLKINDIFNSLEEPINTDEYQKLASQQFEQLDYFLKIN